MTAQHAVQTTRCLPLRALPPAVLLLASAWAAPFAQAITFISTNTFALPENEIANQETWVACDAATVLGNARNDLFIAAQDATLSGICDMDLWAAAQDIRYTGHTEGHLRLAAKSATLSGTAGDNLMCAASTMDITEKAYLQGNALLAGENVLFQGAIDGDLTIYSIRATIGGTIRGTLRVTADEIVVLPTAVLEGNLEYLSARELFLDANVQLGGQLKRITLPPLPEAKQSWSDRLMFQAYFYMSILIVGLAWLFFFPTLTVSAVSAARESLLRCFLIGLAFMFFIPSVIVLIFVSLLGIPLALVLAALYGILLYTAKIVPAYLIGLIILRRTPEQPLLQNAFTVLSSGLLCLYLPAAIPALSFFIWLMATCCGLGALLTAMLRLRHRERLLITIADATPPPNNEETTTPSTPPPEKEP